ncbi:SgcJ/EcaC family oxidoreductase [Streptomyces sp. NPDC052396]|uniref:SgcJ/EcaC family oxidoreductase n=1 Tax=Streptomyces sp. NPDC052396 TaxID=3365689 RepID=UPI0037CE9D45
MRRAFSAGVAVTCTAVLFAGAGAAHPDHAHTPAAHAAIAATAATSKPPTKNQIAGLFNRWNATLAKGDARRVADLYAPNAVLLPTVSSRIRTNRAAIVDYFQHFLESKPSGRIQKRYITILDPCHAVDTGLYQFTLTDKNSGTVSRTNARYTYVYERRGGRWLILNHHSSAVPAGD